MLFYLMPVLSTVPVQSRSCVEHYNEHWEDAVVRPIDLKRAAEKYAQNGARSAPERVEGSIDTYLHGKKYLNWVVGMIHDIDIADAFQMFQRLRGRGLPERNAELAQWFESEMAAQAN